MAYASCSEQYVNLGHRVHHSDLRLFLFDSWWDKYHGSINLVQVVDGVLSGNKTNTVVSSKTGKEYKVKEVGVLTPTPHPCQFLYPGQVGYLVSNMKVRKVSPS